MADGGVPPGLPPSKLTHRMGYFLLPTSVNQLKIIPSLILPMRVLNFINKYLFCLEMLFCCDDSDAVLCREDVDGTLPSDVLGIRLLCARATASILSSASTKVLMCWTVSSLI